MKKLILYLFLVVITNPYEGINYNQINSYDVNYCEGYYCPDTGKDYDYMEEEEIEEIEEELIDLKPLVLDLDFLNKYK